MKPLLLLRQSVPQNMPPHAVKGKDHDQKEITGTGRLSNRTRVLRVYHSVKLINGGYCV